MTVSTLELMTYDTLRKHKRILLRKKAWYYNADGEFRFRSKDDEEYQDAYHELMEEIQYVTELINMEPQENLDNEVENSQPNAIVPTTII